MPVSRFPLIRLVVAGLLGAGFTVLPARADITIEPANPQVGFCTFWGYGSLLDPFDPGNPGRVGPWGPFGALVYRNIPAFDVTPGDILAFDLGAVNEVPPTVDIAFARGQDPVTNNFNDPAEPFTPVVSNTQTPTGRGNTVIGDYDLEYTIEQPYSFPGGTLFIRVSNPTAAYQNDNTCTQIGVYGEPGDANDFFVRRIFGSEIETSPWTGTYSSSINNGVTAFRIINVGAAAADLGVSISGPPSVLIDTDYSYTVEYINSGPDDATDVEVVIATPADIVFVDASPASANCTADSTFGATVTCAIGDLAASDAGTITVDVRSPMTALDRTEATATISAAEIDDDAANDSDTAVVFVNALEIEIEDSRFPNFDRNIDFLPAKPGRTDSQTFTVRNDSPNPVGITVFDAPAAPFMLTDPNSCEVNGVAGGNTCTFNVAFMPTTVGSWSDSIILDFTPGGQTEITLSGNGVPAMADLSLSKTANVTSVTPGDSSSGGNLATYTLTVENRGPDSAEAVVTDMLPAGVTVNGAPPMNYDPATGVWNVGTVAFSDMAGADNTVSLDIPVLVAEGVPVCLTNTASVAIAPDTDTEDANSSNDTAEVLIAAPECVDLAVESAGFDEQIFAGDKCQVIEINTTVANNGATDATDITLSLDATFTPPFLRDSECVGFGPGQLIFPASGNGAIASASLQIASLAAGESSVQTFFLETDIEGPDQDMAVTLTISRDVPDANPADNTLTAGTTISRSETSQPFGSGSGCSMVEAVRASPLEAELDGVRDFRDRWLLSNAAGRAFTAWYYRNSPPFAEMIAANDWLRLLVRTLITPLVFAINYPIDTLLLLALAGWIGVRRLRVA